MNAEFLDTLLCPQDAAKLLYQRTFGCAHITENTQSAKAHLMKECAEAVPADVDLFTSIGHGLARLNLRAAMFRGIRPELIWTAMQTTASQKKGTFQEMQNEIDDFSLSVKKGSVHFSASEWNAFLESWQKQGYPPVSHSATYHQAFSPSYRVLLQDICVLLPLMQSISKMQFGKSNPHLIAIDGPCGCGKTTLASVLSRFLNATLLHVDDFYLLPAKRKANWQQTTAGNLNLPLLQNTLITLLSGKDATAECWQCKSNSFVLHSYKADSIILLEGSYSHFSIEPIAGQKLLVFTEIAPQEQLRRLIRRNPEALSAFQSIWMPMENRYFSEKSVRDKADFVLKNPDNQFSFIS